MVGSLRAQGRAARGGGAESVLRPHWLLRTSLQATSALGFDGHWEAKRKALWRPGSTSLAAAAGLHSQSSVV